MTTKENTLDFTKPIQTRSGKKVRIISVAPEFKQSMLEFTVAAEVEGSGYKTFTSDGFYFTNGDESSLDLQNIPEETFEQRVERFKNSEYFIAEKKSSYGNEIVIWQRSTGFVIFTNFEDVMREVYFK